MKYEVNIAGKPGMIPTGWEPFEIDDYSRGIRKGERLLSLNVVCRYIPPPWAVTGKWLVKVNGCWLYSATSDCNKSYAFIDNELFPDFVEPPYSPYQIPPKE